MLKVEAWTAVCRLTWCLMITIIVCAAGATAVFGDERPSGARDLKNLSIEELMEIEVRTVYAASKHEQKVTEAPASITIVTAGEIKQYGHRTLADVMKSVRGFYVTYDRNYAYLGVRGFGRPGDYNTRVLLMVDGHPINDTIYDTAPIGTEFILDVDLIDRIEISRGPGSSLYGSNALFGVINIITKTGRILNGVEAAAGGGRFDTYRGRLSSGGAAENGDVLLSGTFHRSRGSDLYFPEFDPANPNADPGAANNGVVVNADTDRSQSGFVRASFGDFTLAGGSVYRKKGIPTASFGTLFNTQDTFAVDRHSYGELRYRDDIDARSEISGRLAYDEYRYYGDYVRLDPAPTMVTNHDDVIGRWWSGELMYSRELLPGNKLTIGAAMKDNVRQDQKNFDVDAPATYLDDRRNSFVWAVYAQDEARLHDRLILNAGVRYDHYETFGGAVNPRLNIIYLPAEKTAVKFLYGRAFRSPNMFELYYNDGGISAKSNPDLDPETMNTYEAVLEQYFGGNVRAAVSAYYYDINDLISLETDPVDNLLQYRNGAEIEAQGMELELEGKTAGGVRGVLSAAWQRTRDRQTRELLTNSPRFISKLNMSIPLIRERLFTGIEEQYMSGRRTLAGGVVSGFFVTHVTVLGLNLINGLEASASVYNLFDKRYADPASEEHVQDVIVQDGRDFRFTLTYRY
jgi:iron complex outermembrane receptor protein